jgi:hypothetical protein
MSVTKNMRHPNEIEPEEYREPTVSAHDHEGKEGDHDAIAEVVQEHGPAFRVEHRQREDLHEVHSFHGKDEKLEHTHHSYNHPNVEHTLVHHSYAKDEDSLAAKIQK